MTTIKEKPKGVIRTHHEDFVVEEIPVYTPSGEGQHLFVTFCKRGLTTFQAVERIATLLQVPPRSTGTAGLKDRHAVTTQTASFEYPVVRPLPSLDDLKSDEISVLALARHGNKLKTGHLKGNRFKVTIRGIAPEEIQNVLDEFEQIGKNGMPNWYGEQRFGLFGDNAEVAARWILGKDKPPKDRKLKRLHFSAWQSSLFHEVLKTRIERNNWGSPLPGDLVMRESGGGPHPWRGEQFTGDDELVPTGPMYGSKMRWPTDEPGEIEQAVFDKHIGDKNILSRWATLGEGARRPLKLTPKMLRASKLDGQNDSIVVECVLPAGAYVTTVLAAVCDISDATRSPRGGANENSQPEPEDEEQEDS